MMDHHKVHNQFPIATCVGKHRFETPGLAREIVNRKSPKGGRKYRAEVYRCPHCGGWHIGRNGASEMKWGRR